MSTQPHIQDREDILRGVEFAAKTIVETLAAPKTTQHFELEHRTMFGWSLFKSSGDSESQARKELAYWAANKCRPETDFRIVRATITREVVQ